MQSESNAIQQMISEILNGIVHQIIALPRKLCDTPLVQSFPHTYHENYKIYQGTCYQQFSPNLCGYHAIFNTFCFLKALHQQSTDFDVNSGASFWKFKIRVQNFLFDMKRKYKLGEQWPWRDKDIRQGDFQRTYNKICLERFQEFSIFKKSKKFYYLSSTWLFQYQNLVLDYEGKQELNKKFKEFRQYSGKKPMILHLMLGITTHWLTFLAVKSGKNVEYWFFDSFNTHHLDFCWEEITNLIENKSKERIKWGKPQFTKFQKQSYCMCIKDIQTSLKLIIQCLEGQQTLDSYSYNQKFFLFADPLQAAMAVDYHSVSIVVKQYQHNIRSFFVQKLEWNLLDHHNHSLMKSIIEYSAKVKNHGQEGRFLYFLTNQSSRNHL